MIKRLIATLGLVGILACGQEKIQRLPSNYDIEIPDVSVPIGPPSLDIREHPYPPFVCNPNRKDIIMSTSSTSAPFLETISALNQDGTNEEVYIQGKAAWISGITKDKCGIAVSTSHPEEDRFTLHIMNSDGTGIQTVEEMDNEPEVAFSNNGKKFAYQVAYRNCEETCPPAEIHVVNLEDRILTIW